MPVFMILRTFLLAMLLALEGCNLDALLSDPKAAQREADAKAIGGACRHGLRSIEDCYLLNDKSSKAAIFAGWKDMDQYMRDNKIEGIVAREAKPATLPSVEPGEDGPSGASAPAPSPAPVSRDEKSPALKTQ